MAEPGRAAAPWSFLIIKSANSYTLPRTAFNLQLHKVTIFHRFGVPNHPLRPLKMVPSVGYQIRGVWPSEAVLRFHGHFLL